MNFTKSIFPTGVLCVLLVCSTWAEDGIKVLSGDTPGQSGIEATQGADSQKIETKVKVEVSKFPLTETDSPQLVLAKIYDTTQAMGNSFILHLDGEKHATIIDPGYNGQAIAKYLEQEKLVPDAILLTNGYFVRIADNANLKKRWPDLKIAIGKEDAPMLTDTKANQSESFGGVTSPEADVTLQGGETLKTSGEIPWTVLATPGHTPGSLSYQIDTHEKRLIFTGDFIYRDGTSNTELPLANSETFEESLHAFLENEPHDALVYPGFGPNTTVGEFYSNLSQHATNNEAVNDLAMDSGTAVAYQATYSEVYPTTTIIYDDLYEPYYPIIGFRVWPWRPIRPLPPPPPHRPHHPHHPPGPHPGPHPHPHPHPGPGPRPVIDPHDRPGHWNPANRPDPAVRPHHEPNHSGGNRPSPGIHHVPDHRLNPAFRLDRPSHSPNRVSPAPFRPGGRGAPGNVIHPGGSGFHGRGGHVPHGGGGFHGGGHGGRH